MRISRINRRALAADSHRNHQPHGVSRGCGTPGTGANAHRLIWWDVPYKEVVHAEVAHRPPREVLDELAASEKEITQGMMQLRGMLTR